MASRLLADLRKAQAEKPQPTEEQNEIVQKGAESSSNIVINALAGTGKTTTLEMLQAACKDKPILYLAFNKKTADEAKGRFASTTTVQTLNGCGQRAWAVNRTVSVADPDGTIGQKTKVLFREMIKEMPKDTQKTVWEVFWEVVKGVDVAKFLGYVPEGKYPYAKRLAKREEIGPFLDEKPDELVLDLIDALLSRSIKAAYDGYIDFNDQIYMPTLFNGTFPRYPLVMGDEAQDFSPINHEMLNKLARGRFIAVGDPWQSIYAFRGAKTRSMQELTERFKAETCTLSLCFRCPKPVVEAARFRAPNLRWLKEEGRYEVLKNLEPKSISENAVIVCRNNAPLFKLALQLLQAGRSISVAGSEIGPKTVSIMRRLGDTDMSMERTLSVIENWRSEKLSRESKTANDTADCMKVFAMRGRTLGEAIVYAEHLFKQKGSIELITGHKAKGLEWDTVYHLDPWLCRQDDQDQNLKYVITTRAKHSLFEIDSERIR